MLLGLERIGLCAWHSCEWWSLSREWSSFLFLRGLCVAFSGMVVFSFHIVGFGGQGLVRGILGSGCPFFFLICFLCLSDVFLVRTGTLATWEGGHVTGD